METQSYWNVTGSLPQFEALTKDVEVDVVVIGAGLTGITAAYLLKQSGAKVALLERDRCAGGDTGRTTAHLTYVTDKRLNRLVKEWGRDGAKAFWDAGIAAIDEIYRIVRDARSECEFQWVPGYLHGSLEEETRLDRESLEQDFELARELGFQVERVAAVPYCGRAGIRFKGQAKFHPIKYLRPLLEKLPGNGSYVFENTTASAIESNPLTVQAGRNRIRCSYLVIATHNPLMGKTGLVSATLFQTKLMLYTSYVLGAKLPRGTLPEALFWDTTDPYYYLRVDRRTDHDYIIFGGKDVKTGQEQGPVFEKLQAVLRSVLPDAEVQQRWLGQVVETNDGLPFVGESAGQQFIATGFCGNGFTLGTLSAVMARDRYLGRKNPWYDLFAVNRKKFHGGTWRYITENLDYPYYLVRDRLTRPAEGSTADLSPGQGRVMRMQGKNVAAYRDPAGKLTLLTPVCSHLGCLVRWNEADQTWDCPCHGSRFKVTGEVYAGPAEEPLQRISFAKEGQQELGEAA